MITVAVAANGQTVSEQDVQTLEEAARQYMEMSGDYKRDLEAIIRWEINKRRSNVEESFNREIGKLQDQLYERRNEAIAVFERFVNRYPLNRKYTPDVLFRLAELYYAQAQDDAERAKPEYEERLKLYERGKIAERPEEPMKDYSKAIATYQLLVTRFPDYANVDAAYYALGYCLNDMGERVKAMAAFRELVEKVPNSPLVAEAWLLIGELYFEVGQYAESIEAYSHTLKDEKGKYYDLALYKLAWSYFNLNQYPTAIRTFKRLIERIDNKTTTSALGPLLRKEAIDYLGISLADDDWNGDGEKDPDATVARAVSYLSEGKPFEREVLKKYAETLYEQHEMSKYPMAIEAYRAVIARDPLNPENAQIKERIVAIYDTMRDIEKMTAERLELVRDYGPGSAWYAANAGRPEVLAGVDRQIELALSQAAQFHNKRAQDLKAQAATTGKEEFNVAAVQEYKKAAQVYEDYLRQFPGTKQAYEHTYFLAECYYYSFDFEKATKNYIKVRDWPGRTERQEMAAYNVIIALEKEAAKRIQEGRLPGNDMPGDASAVEVVIQPETEGKVVVDPQPIPQLTLEWIAAVDWYLSKDYKPKDPEQRVRLAFRVAAELYKRRHLEEARRRFEEIMVKYPESALASAAAVGIINSYRMENDWENIALWSKKIDELKIGKPEERAALAQEVKIFQLGAQFKEAEKAFEDGDYKKAAETFIAVVDADPKSSVADKALQNAAIAYQKMKYYDSAARVYQRIVSEYPNSQYVEAALFQIAENAKKFFDFERAVTTFEALRTRFPKSQHVAYAMFQVATLLEAQGKLKDAAKAFERIVDEFPTDPETPAMLFRAGVLYEKIAEREEALRVYKRFYKQFGGLANQNERVIEALARSADIYRVLGQVREWETMAKTVIKEFAARGMQPGTMAAAQAARMQFALVEEQFKQYEAIQFKGSLKEQGRLVQQKRKMLQDLELAYAQVLPYKSIEWTSAAVFRMAQIHELFARALFEAEVPKMTEEEEDLYRTQLEDAAKGYLDTAQERYVKVIEENRRLKRVNEWTKKAVEAMNRYRPAEFPLDKQERQTRDMEVRLIPRFEESL